MTAFMMALIANIIIWLIVLLFILLLSKKTNFIKNNFLWLIAFSGGLVLGIVFLSIIPEITEHWLVGEKLGISILGWLIFFYLIELVLHVHHCHCIQHIDHKETECNQKDKHWKNYLMFVGSFLDNFVHWIILISGFGISVEFGLSMSLVILIHAIPQNIANYIMNHNNLKVVWTSILWWVIWTLFFFPFLDLVETYENVILWVIAWWLLYLALSDLLPEFKKKDSLKQNLGYFALMLLGLGIMIVFTVFGGH